KAGLRPSMSAWWPLASRSSSFNVKLFLSVCLASTSQSLLRTSLLRTHPLPDPALVVPPSRLASRFSCFCHLALGTLHRSPPSRGGSVNVNDPRQCERTDLT